MSDAAWERLVEAIDLKLGIKRHGHETRQAEDRPDIDLKVEFFEFSRGPQNFRLERISGPAIIDKKSHYSRGGGGSVRFETLYDMTETAHQVVVLREAGGRWEQVQLEELSLG